MKDSLLQLLRSCISQFQLQHRSVRAGRGASARREVGTGPPIKIEEDASTDSEGRPGPHP